MIGNYRPLSLASTDYKILAKIITERLKPALKQIIGTEQQGWLQELNEQKQITETMLTSIVKNTL